jgi:hypothetical protein
MLSKVGQRQARAHSWRHDRGSGLTGGLAVITPPKHILARGKMGRDLDDVHDSNHRSDARHSFAVVNVRRVCGLFVAVVAAGAITARGLRARGAATRSGWVVFRVARVGCFRVVLRARDAHGSELSRRDGDHCPRGVGRCGAFADLHASSEPPR